jgi:sarcosine oxidase
MTRSFDVAVVGLGAMGSAAAFHLARRGQRVLGLDRFTPPHAHGSSHGRTRIIREAYFEDPLYVPLVQRAYPLWRELEAQTGRTLLTITGALMIGHEDGTVVAGARRSAIEHRLEYEMLTGREVAARFPVLRPDDDMVAVWEPGAGVLFPEACVDAHLGLARAHGATLHFDEPVTAWHTDGAGTNAGVRIVTPGGEYRAGQLLLTAGAWVGSLVPEMAKLLTIERQVVYWLSPRGDPSRFAPSRCPIHLWETPTGRFFYGFGDFGDGVKVALHHAGAATDPDHVRRTVSHAETAAIRGYVRRFIPDADGPLLDASVCLYTNTPDEHFWIDRHPQHAQVLVASACSGHGFKFSPTIGEALADLLIDGRSRADLSRFVRR